MTHETVLEDIVRFWIRYIEIKKHPGIYPKIHRNTRKYSIVTSPELKGLIRKFKAEKCYIDGVIHERGIPIKDIHSEFFLLNPRNVEIGSRGYKLEFFAYLQSKGKDFCDLRRDDIRKEKKNFDKEWMEKVIKPLRRDLKRYNVKPDDLFYLWICINDMREYYILRKYKGKYYSIGMLKKRWFIPNQEELELIAGGLKDSLKMLYKQK